MGIKTEVAKNNIVYTVGNIAAALLSFIFSVVVARILQPEQFGLFSFTLVVMGFFAIFVDPGVSMTIIKFASESMERGENSKVRYFLRFLFRFKISLTILIGIFIAAFSSQISAYVFGKPDQGFFIVLAAVVLISNSLYDYASNALISFKNFRVMTALRIAERVFRISFVVLLVLIGLGAAGAALGVAAGFLAVGMVGVFWIRVKYRNVFVANGSPLNKAPLLAFGMWAFAGTTITSIYMQLDSLMISMLRPVQDVGFYSIASSWVSLIIYIIPISSIVMYPYFSGLGGSKSSEALRRSVKYMMIFVMPVAFLMSAFSASIISLFYTESFLPAASPLSLLSFVSIPLVFGPLLLSFLYGIGKPKLHTIIISFVFVLGIILNYFAIITYGIWGSAAAMLITRMIEMCLLAAAITLTTGAIFRLADIVKPLVASIFIYIMAVLVGASVLPQLIVYGVLLLLVYAGIMLAIGGIRKGDVMTVLGWIKKN